MKQNREVTEQCENMKWREEVKCEIKTKCPDLKRDAPSRQHDGVIRAPTV